MTRLRLCYRPPMMSEPTVIGIRFYFHCGWAIQVDPTFDSEIREGGETLRMFTPGDRREVYLSSMLFHRHDGKPFTASDVIDVFPPPEMTGIRYEHHHHELAGSALWMFGESDEDPEPHWVLMAVMACPPAGKIARCTIVCCDEADRDWAVATWRTIVRASPPKRKMPSIGLS